MKLQTDNTPYLNFFTDKNNTKNNLCYIILDEAHYFYTDSLFNTLTYTSFQYLLSNYKHAITIFLSATFSIIRKDLIEKIECQLMHIDYISQTQNSHAKENLNSNNKFPNISNKPDSIIEYEVKENFSNIQLNTILDIEHITPLIQSLHTNEKFVIFVDTIKNGDLIQDSLQSKLGLCIPFHKSRYSPMFNTREELNELLNISDFSSRGIIATSTLDNGINLKNAAIKHIFILITDYEEFIQMLGRKRLDSNEKLNVYILKRKRNYYLSKKYYYQTLLDACLESLKLNDLQIANNLLNPNKQSPFLTFTFYSKFQIILLKATLNMTETEHFYFNPFSISRIQSLFNYYEFMDNNFIDSDPFVREVCEWLNIKPCDVREYIPDTKNISSIVNTIITEHHLTDKELNTQDINSLFNEYKELINSSLDSNSKIKSTDPISASKFAQFLNKCDDECMYKAEIVNQKKIVILLK